MPLTDSKSEKAELDLELTGTLKAITEWLERIEARLDSRPSDHQPPHSHTEGSLQEPLTQAETPGSAQEPFTQAEGQGRDPYILDLGSVKHDNAFLDIQRQFDSLRDILSRVQIPAYCKVKDSAVGIKTDCKPVLKVINKSARFAETGLKILGNLPQEP
ncbi:hypothetical protein PoB_006916300 [Plakobranchus ocellatus]|uniref:Dystrophin n=1 Tax=Plakobranchus ocellatus TaxID=259542 RepID=A0AAV4DEK1_9GAST|nr:hypothetical protein PoB_006916300 [Plakobranchus ocellatus]